MNKTVILTLIFFAVALASVGAQEFTYDDAGRLKTAWYPSGQVMQYTYDPAGNIEDIAVFLDEDLDGIYDNWEINFYGSIGAALPEGDDEPDGVVNLAEFNFGFSPNKVSPVDPTVITIAYEPGQSFLEFTYKRAKLGALFNNFTVEVSFDGMKTWLSGPAHVTQMGAAAEIDADTEEISFRVLSARENHPKMFVRLKVSKKE